MSDASEVLDHVEYALDNPSADDAAQRLREAAEVAGRGRPDTRELLLEAADDYEGGNPKDAASNLATVKLALTLIGA